MTATLLASAFTELASPSLAMKTTSLRRLPGPVEADALWKAWKTLRIPLRVSHPLPQGLESSSHFAALRLPLPPSDLSTAPPGPAAGSVRSAR